MTAILGINAFHPDSSACLLLDGKLIGAVAEERFGQRNRHTSEFPENAIRWVLKEAGIRLRDVTHVAVARKANANFTEKAQYIFRNPISGYESLKHFRFRQKRARLSIRTLSATFDEDPSFLKFKFYNVEHHIAHIASSYYLSPFDETTAGFSYDGSGDFVTAMAARCEGTRIEVIDKVSVPNSLGFFYTAMCQFIGFDQFGEEFKVMGLAPYGENKFAEAMSEVLKIDDTPWFKINPKYFFIARGLNEAQLTDDHNVRLGRIYSDALIDLFGIPRKRGSEITQREKDIAQSTQAHFEEAAKKCLRLLSTHVPLKRLAMAGGCALNGVMNAKIYRDFPVENMYIQPASSDDGTALGAAYHCWHMHLGRTERFEMKHAFWGPKYNSEKILGAIEAAGLRPYRCSNEQELTRMTAGYIADGAVVGWYQGRSEWGPRALGNRSIIANPSIHDMKDKINRKIKKRESFRPFAPSVLREDVNCYFEQDIQSPFMMHVVKFKPKWRGVFPAVTHIDGTARLQTVDEENNPRYYRLIKSFKDITGFGIILNTSFNENEPVVDSPEQAISCFLRTDLDVLVMDEYILAKNRQD